jgi:hypothetical protein
MNVTLLNELRKQALEQLLAGFDLLVHWLPANAPIPGSYWGEPEAGLVGNTLYVRNDTPVHSALHEACHYLLMDNARRLALSRDAGGSDTEENAVCYLQCLLADRLAGYSRMQMFADMDAWGYHFILGSAAAWFARDSDDAQAWLRQQRALNAKLKALPDLAL